MTQHDLAVSIWTSIKNIPESVFFFKSASDDPSITTKIGDVDSYKGVELMLKHMAYVFNTTTRTAASGTPMFVAAQNCQGALESAMEKNGISRAILQTKEQEVKLDSVSTTPSKPTSLIKTCSNNSSNTSRPHPKSISQLATGSHLSLNHNNIHALPHTSPTSTPSHSTQLSSQSANQHHSPSTLLTSNTTTTSSAHSPASSDNASTKNPPPSSSNNLGSSNTPLTIHPPALPRQTQLITKPPVPARKTDPISPPRKKVKIKPIRELQRHSSPIKHKVSGESPVTDQHTKSNPPSPHSPLYSTHQITPNQGDTGHTQTSLSSNKVTHREHHVVPHHPVSAQHPHRPPQHTRKESPSKPKTTLTPMSSQPHSLLHHPGTLATSAQTLPNPNRLLSQCPVTQQSAAYSQALSTTQQSDSADCNVPPESKVSFFQKWILYDLESDIAEISTEIAKQQTHLNKTRTQLFEQYPQLAAQLHGQSQALVGDNTSELQQASHSYSRDSAAAPTTNLPHESRNNPEGTCSRDVPLLRDTRHTNTHTSVVNSINPPTGIQDSCATRQRHPGKTYRQGIKQTKQHLNSDSQEPTQPHTQDVHYTAPLPPQKRKEPRSTRRKLHPHTQAIPHTKFAPPQSPLPHEQQSVSIIQEIRKDIQQEKIQPMYSPTQQELSFIMDVIPQLDMTQLETVVTIVSPQPDTQPISELQFDLQHLPCGVFEKLVAFLSSCRAAKHH
ncbi:hypothetical protein Pelo_5224 [Pelomyxa schiedti]|nr:hypothetical protein Pelo_5224 [Pelomyxa schiedti]